MENRKDMLSNTQSGLFKYLEKLSMQRRITHKISLAQKEAVGRGLHWETRAIWWKILKATKNKKNQWKSAHYIKSQRWWLEETFNFYIW